VVVDEVVVDDVVEVSVAVVLVSVIVVVVVDARHTRGCVPVISPSTSFSQLSQGS
jgi:hypothetical protein